MEPETQTIDQAQALQIMQLTSYALLHERHAQGLFPQAVLVDGRLYWPSDEACYEDYQHALRQTTARPLPYGLFGR